jgi:hypothetical protein
MMKKSQLFLGAALIVPLLLTWIGVTLLESKPANPRETAPERESSPLIPKASPNNEITF